MKINWGTGIVIAMALFISFILYFVLQMTLSSDYDDEMVEENYYQQEYVYQQEIDGRQNASALKQDIIVNKKQGAFHIDFPQEFDYNAITGTIYMYRPADKTLDFKIPIKLESSNYTIPLEMLTKGKWEIKISWEYEDMDYRFKKVLYN